MKQQHKQVVAALLAIRRHARRIQNRKSAYGVYDQAEAIAALAGIGLKAANKIKLATVGSNANMGRENETKS